jgi:hypothetical protein
MASRGLTHMLVCSFSQMFTEASTHFYNDLFTYYLFASKALVGFLAAEACN